MSRRKKRLASHVRRLVEQVSVSAPETQIELEATRLKTGPYKKPRLVGGIDTRRAS